MARPKMFHRGFAMRWTPLEESLVRYYASRHGKDMAAIVTAAVRFEVDALVGTLRFAQEIVRRIIVAFAEADTSLYWSAVKEHYDRCVAPAMAGDPEALADGKDRLESFHQKRACRALEGVTKRRLRIPPVVPMPREEGLAWLGVVTATINGPSDRHPDERWLPGIRGFLSRLDDFGEGRTATDET